MSFKYPESSLVTAIDAGSFQSFIDTNENVFIHFGADWNGHDWQMIPNVELATKQHEGKVWFAFMDIDLKMNWDLLKEHGLYNVPYFEYYEGGKLTEAITGGLSGERLRALFTKKAH